VDVVVLLLVGRRIVQERLHHGLLAHPVLGHGRSELGGTSVDRLHSDVVDGALVHGRYVLNVVGYAVVNSHRYRLPHLLRDPAQLAPVLGVQVAEPVQRASC